MNKSPKLYLLVGLALLVAALLAIYLTVAIGQGENNVQTHLTSGTISQSECSACHQEVLERGGYDAHYLKRVRGRGLAFFDKGASNYDGCGKCHQATDLLAESAASLRKQVDPAFCLSCHGAFTASKHASVDYPAASCGLGVGNCHSPGSLKDPAPAHQGRTYINQIIASASAFCLDCHGGRKLYSTSEETNLP